MKKTFRMCDVTMVLLAAVIIFAMAWLLGAVGHAEAMTALPAELATIDLTGIVQAVVAVLCALITHRLLPWIKANTAQKQQSYLQAMIDTAVYAAQQLYKTNVIRDRMKYAEDWLRGKGYSVDRAQIEAAVRRMDSMALEVTAESIGGAVVSE